MQQFFLEGGVGMLPTALFGLASLALAVGYAVRPQPRLFPLVAGSGAAALLAGALGMMLGFKATVSAIVGRPPAAPEQVQLITLAGLYESANNLVLALALTTLVALALGVGGFRARRPAVT
jgi:hypothetical protein